MTVTAPARDPEVRLGQLKFLAGLLPYLWPTGRGDLKARVAVAVVFLVLAKLATVTVPLVLKEAVDALTPAGAVETAAGLAIALPLAMLLAYGVVRVAAVAFGGLRDMLDRKGAVEGK